MKFLRKLITHNGHYGSVSVPKPVFDSWAAVEIVEMMFDGTNLIVTPIREASNGNF